MLKTVKLKLKFCSFKRFPVHRNKFFAQKKPINWIITIYLTLWMNAIEAKKALTSHWWPFNLLMHGRFYRPKKSALGGGKTWFFFNICMLIINMIIMLGLNLNSGVCTLYTTIFNFPISLAYSAPNLYMKGSRLIQRYTKQGHAVHKRYIYVQKYRNTTYIKYTREITQNQYIFKVFLAKSAF